LSLRLSSSSSPPQSSPSAPSLPPPTDTRSTLNPSSSSTPLAHDTAASTSAAAQCRPHCNFVSVYSQGFSSLRFCHTLSHAIACITPRRKQASTGVITAACCALWRGQSGRWRYPA
jgi:hypothetical protein